MVHWLRAQPFTDLIPYRHAALPHDGDGGERPRFVVRPLMQSFTQRREERRRMLRDGERRQAVRHHERHVERPRAGMDAGLGWLKSIGG